MFGAQTKFRIIFLPYLLISVSVISLFSFAKWFFEVKHRMMLMHSFFFDTVACMVLMIVLIATIIRRRLHILDVRSKEGKLNYGGFYIVMLLSVVVPINFAINYVGKAGYDLKHINRAEEILTAPITRYYAIDTIKLMDKKQKVRFRRYTSDKGGRTLNFSCKVAYPILQQSDTLKIGKMWYVASYHHSMSNNASLYEKEVAYNNFHTDCTERINSLPYSIGRPVYFDNIPDDAFREDIIELIFGKDAKHDDAAILMPVYEKFEYRAFWSAVGFCISWFVGLLLVWIMLLAADFHSEQLQAYYDKTLLHSGSDIQNAVHYLHSHRYHPLALLLMAVIITLFVLWIWYYC